MKTRIKIRILNLAYLLALIIFMFYVICSIIYKTPEGVTLMALFMLSGTFSFAFLRRKFDKEELAAKEELPQT